MSDALAWPLLLGVLGAVFGSHIATVAIRWPGSAMVGRSHCDSCGATLRAVELVPLLSWAAQRGACRRCDARIAPAHALVEALGLAIGVVAGLVAPGLVGASGAVFGWLLLTLAAIDVAAFRLPNGLVGVLAAGGIAAGLADVGPALPERLIGGAAGFAALWLVAAGYRAARGRVGLGSGDPKLFGAIGLWLGWRALPNVLLMACLFGLAIVALQTIRGRRMSGTDRLPFGALLAPAAFVGWCLPAG